MNNKGFILLDSLITIILIGIIAMFVLSTYQLIGNFNDTYDNYQENMADNYTYIYEELSECEVCLIEEENEMDLLN